MGDNFHWKVFDEFRKIFLYVFNLNVKRVLDLSEPFRIDEKLPRVLILSPNQRLKG